MKVGKQLIFSLYIPSGSSTQNMLVVEITISHFAASALRYHPCRMPVTVVHAAGENDHQQRHGAGGGYCKQLTSRKVSQDANRDKDPQCLGPDCLRRVVLTVESPIVLLSSSALKVLVHEPNIVRGLPGNSDPHQWEGIVICHVSSSIGFLKHWVSNGVAVATEAQGPLRRVASGAGYSLSGLQCC